MGRPYHIAAPPAAIIADVTFLRMVQTPPCQRRAGVLGSVSIRLCQGLTPPAALLVECGSVMSGGTTDTRDPCAQLSQTCSSLTNCRHWATDYCLQVPTDELRIKKQSPRAPPTLASRPASHEDNPLTSCGRLCLCRSAGGHESLRAVSRGDSSSFCRPSESTVKRTALI